MALVIYDLDETLINKNCSLLWLHFLHHQGLIGQETLAEERRMDTLYQQGQLDITAYLKMLLKPHIGKTLQQLKDVVSEFINRYVIRHFRPSAVKNIKQHQDQGDRCIVVSASVDFLVKPISHQLGIEDAIGVQVETQDDKITGKAEGVICFQEGKVAQLQEWLQQHPENLENSWFYTDSHNDLPLLEKVCNPVAVTPDKKLRAIAAENDWPVYEW